MYTTYSVSVPGKRARGRMRERAYSAFTTNKNKRTTATCAQVNFWQLAKIAYFSLVARKLEQKLEFFATKRSERGKNSERPKEAFWLHVRSKKFLNFVNSKTTTKK